MAKTRDQQKRTATTLLELMVATAMMAVLMTSTVVVVRSAQTAWRAHRDDTERAESAYATLRHIVRFVRQATDVTSLTVPTDDAGELSLLLATGDTITYEASGTNIVFHKTGYTNSSLLADNINSLTFVGYEADATTTTTELSDIQAIECIVDFTTPLGNSRKLSTFAWLRSW